MTRRRTVIAAALGLVGVARLVIPVGLAPAQAAEPAFVLGNGAANAQVVKARVFYAGYALSVPLGQAATTYENRQSRALGGAYDLSAATGLAGVKRPELSSAAINSNSGDATKSTNVGADSLGSIVLHARAVPSSQSDVHLADVDVPGVVNVKGGHVMANAEVVDGKTRVAEASVSIAAVSLAGGLVELHDLRWTASQRSGATKKAEGAFAVGSLSIGGVPLAANLQNLDSVLKAVNKALAQTGLVLRAPKVTKFDRGAVDVSAISVAVDHSPLGAKYLGPLLAQLRPQLLPAFEALTNLNTTLGLAGLVSDLGFGVVDGSGGLEVSIGGAAALTGDKAFSNPLGGDGGGVPTITTPDNTTVPATSFPSLIAGAPATTGTQRVAYTPGSAAKCVLASAARKGDCRGTNLPAAVAVVAVVAVAIGTYDAVLRRRRASAAEVAS